MKDYAGTYGLIPTLLLMDQEMAPETKLVYAMYACFADAQGLCWPRQAPMAKQFGMAQSTLSYHTAKLVKAGWLVKARHARNFCRVVFQKDPQRDIDPAEIAAAQVIDSGSIIDSASISTDASIRENIPVSETSQYGESNQERESARTRVRTHVRVTPPQAPPPGAAFPHFAEWLQRPEQRTLRLSATVPEQNHAYNRARTEAEWDAMRRAVR